MCWFGGFSFAAGPTGPISSSSSASSSSSSSSLSSSSFATREGGRNHLVNSHNHKDIDADECCGTLGGLAANPHITLHARTKGN